jgi:hypothetical protein
MIFQDIIFNENGHGRVNLEVILLAIFMNAAGTVNNPDLLIISEYVILVQIVMEGSIVKQ